MHARKCVRLVGTGPRCGSLCPLSRLRRLAVGVGEASTSFVPQLQLAEISDPDAQALAARLYRVPVEVDHPSVSITPLMTAFAGPSEEELAAYPEDAPAVVCLHSFDSSCLEFRRLYPLLSRQLPTFAVDLVCALAI